MIDLTSDAFLKGLVTALVEVEESKVNWDCIADTCDHDECPEEPGVGCGDAEQIRDELLKVLHAPTE